MIETLEKFSHGPPNAAFLHVSPAGAGPEDSLILTHSDLSVIAKRCSFISEESPCHSRPFTLCNFPTQSLHWMLRSFTKVTRLSNHSIQKHSNFTLGSLDSSKRAFHFTSTFQRAEVAVRSRNSVRMSVEMQTKTGQPFDRTAFESLLRRKTFLWQSFEPYGSVKVGSIVGFV